MPGVIPSWELDQPGVYHLPAAERTLVTTADVRKWAKAVGLEVGQRGHLPESVVEQFNRQHRFVRYESANPQTRKGK